MGIKNHEITENGEKPKMLTLDEVCGMGLGKKHKQNLIAMFEGCVFQIEDGAFKIVIPPEFYENEVFKTGAIDKAKRKLSQRAYGHKRKHDALVKKNRGRYAYILGTYNYLEAIFWQTFGLTTYEGVEFDEAFEIACNMLRDADPELWERNGSTIETRDKARIFNRITGLQKQLLVESKLKGQLKDQMDQFTMFEEPEVSDLVSQAKMLLNGMKAGIENVINTHLKKRAANAERAKARAQEKRKLKLKSASNLKSEGGPKAVRERISLVRLDLQDLSGSLGELPLKVINRIIRRAPRNISDTSSLSTILRVGA
ncbi:hypothetical protein HOG48_05890 [Candidatus Peregrinibacteria bacterium]|jgi:hypothetical protein|nr:hypothetical protein [Candidatus Peregrinibacteria bacterium]